MIKSLHIGLFTSSLAMGFSSAQAIQPQSKISINETDGIQASIDFGATFNNAIVSVRGGCTGVLVAPNIVLSARHCAGIWESGGAVIDFGPNSNNPIFSANVESFVNPAGGDSNSDFLDGGDFTILTLDQAVPESIATPFRLAEETNELVGSVVALVGYGLNGLGNTGGQDADGLRWGAMNTLEAYGTPVQATGGSSYFSTDFDDGNEANNFLGSATPIALEGTVAQGDSGGPLLVRLGNEWVVAGVLSGGTTAGGTYGDVSWWQGIQIFRSDIEAVGGVFTSVLREDFYWSGGNGVWNSTNTNWTNVDGTTTVAFSENGAGIFQGNPGVITLDGTVKPGELTFNVGGYTLTGGTLNTDGGAALQIANAGDTVTLNTEIKGDGALTISGLGGAINTGTITSALALEAGTSLDNQGTISGVSTLSGVVTNNGAGIFSGNTTLTSGGTLSSDVNGLGDTITFTNEGVTTLTGNDTIASYISNAATLSGAGVLTATTYDLNDGSTVNAQLGAGTVEADGTVQLNASVDAHLNVNTGVTTNAGSLNGNVNVLGGELITGNNGISDTSNVTNAGKITLSGNDTIANYTASRGTLTGSGILRVNGNFSGGGVIETTATSRTQLSLVVDASNATTTLGSGSTLKFSAGNQQLQTFDSFNLFDGTTGIVGAGFENFDLSELDPNISGVFEVSTGKVIITSGSDNLGGNTSNTTAVATGIVGGDVKARFSNVTSISNSGSAVINLAGENAVNLGVTLLSQLQEISPEVYGGIAEYGTRANLNIINNVISAPYVIRNGEWHVFAGLSTYDLETSSSLDNADYTLDSTNGYVGVARQYSKLSRYGFFGAANTGDIKSSFLDLDASGQTVGFFTEKELNMPWYDGMRWGRFRTTVSYSAFDYDGTRLAQGLTNNVNDASSSVFQVGLDYRATLFDYGNFKATPFVGANYIKSSSDAFTETGSINSLTVHDFDRNQLIANIGIESIWTPGGGNFGFTAKAELQKHFMDNETELSASFAGASRDFTIISPGVSGTTVELGLGAFIKLNKTSMLRANVFSLIGDDIEDSSGANVSLDFEW